MKKYIYLFISIFILNTVSSQTIIFTEDFNYPTGITGDSIGATATVGGLGSSVWKVHSGFTTQKRGVLFNTTSLTLPGYAGTAIGGAAVYRNLTGSADINAYIGPISIGSVYAAFLIKVDSVTGRQTTCDYGIHFTDTSGTNGLSNHRARIFICAGSDSLTKFKIGIGKGSSSALTTPQITAGLTPPQFAPNEFNIGQTYLCVLKYQFNNAVLRDDSSSLYIFSGALPLSEPAPLAAIRDTAISDLKKVESFCIRQGSIQSNKVNIDAIRIFTSWNAATINAINGSGLLKVNTSIVSSVSFSSAIVGGNVGDTGSSAVIQRGIVYGTSLNPTLSNTKVSMGTGMGTFSQSITGLSPATLYHVRAYAINNTDTAYGGDSTFTTLASPSPYVKLKVFLEAMYLGNNNMTAAPYSADAVSPNSIADTIRVNLHQATSPNNLVFSAVTTLNTSGVATLSFPSSAYGNAYYIAIKHRNSIETWSASSVMLSDSNTIDFSSSPSQVFGSNVSAIANGKYALFTGDINQDGSVDFNDYPSLDIRSSNGELGYLAEDLNGDASVDFNDYPLLDINSSNGIISLKP